MYTIVLFKKLIHPALAGYMAGNRFKIQKKLQQDKEYQM